MLIAQRGTVYRIPTRIDGCRRETPGNNFAFRNIFDHLCFKLPLWDQHYACTQWCCNTFSLFRVSFPCSLPVKRWWKQPGIRLPLNTTMISHPPVRRCSWRQGRTYPEGLSCISPIRNTRLKLVNMPTQQWMGSPAPIITWRVPVSDKNIYLTYVCSFVPFYSSRTGVKLLSYTVNCWWTQRLFLRPEGVGV